MTYCSIHGIDYSGSQCPHCTTDTLDAIDALKTATKSVAWEQANPGSFQCPSCKYITLKRDASKCPKCQGDVLPEYWNNVAAQEKAAAIRAKEAAKDASLDEKIRIDGERIRKEIEEARVRRIWLITALVTSTVVVSATLVGFFMIGEFNIFRLFEQLWLYKVLLLFITGVAGIANAKRLVDIYNSWTFEYTISITIGLSALIWCLVIIIDNYLF